MARAIQLSLQDSQNGQRAQPVNQGLYPNTNLGKKLELMFLSSQALKHVFNNNFG